MEWDPKTTGAGFLAVKADPGLAVPVDRMAMGNPAVARTVPVAAARLEAEVHGVVLAAVALRGVPAAADLLVDLGAVADLVVRVDLVGAVVVLAVIGAASAVRAESLIGSGVRVRRRLAMDARIAVPAITDRPRLARGRRHGTRERSPSPARISKSPIA